MMKMINKYSYCDLQERERERDQRRFDVIVKRGGDDHFVGVGASGVNLE
jgi:hypothetical protein